MRNKPSVSVFALRVLMLLNLGDNDFLTVHWHTLMDFSRSLMFIRMRPPINVGLVYTGVDSRDPGAASM
jgi:hypothetical protein